MNKGQYIKDGSHPAYAALGEVYGEKSAAAPVPVKWGVVRNGAQVDPGHFEVAGAAPAGDDLDRLLDGLPAGAAAAPGDELDKLLDSVPAHAGEDAPDEIVTTSAPRYTGVRPRTSHTLPPLALPANPDLQTMEGRAQRDMVAAHGSDPNANLTFDLSLPHGFNDWSELTGDDAARASVRQYAQTHDIPAPFVEKFLAANGSLIHMRDKATGESKAPADYIYEGSEAFDFEKRTLRVSARMPLLKKLRDDYTASLSTIDRAGEFMFDGQRSPGEKVLGVAAPVAGAVARGAEMAARPFSAVDAAVWSKLRTGFGAADVDPLTAYSIAQALTGGETPAYAQNPIAEGVRHSETLRSINPRLPALAGGITEAVTSPSNLLGLGVGKAGMQALKSSRLGAGVAAGLSEAMGGESKLAAFFSRGGRILDIEAAPLERAAAAGGAAGSSASPVDALLVTIKDHEGNLHRINTATGEIEENIKNLPRVMGMSVADALEKHPKLDQHVAERLANAHERAASFEAEAARPDLPDDYRQTHAEQAARAHDEAAYLRDVQAAIEDHRTAGASQNILGDKPVEMGPGKTSGSGEAAPAASLPRRVARQFVSAYHLPKSFQASADLSATMRQGLIPLAAHPSFIADVMKNQVKAFASQDAADALKEAIINHPDFNLMKESGLYLSSVRGSAPEEMFSSAWSEKIPVVKQSDRAYSAALDTVRGKSFELYAAELKAAGVTDEKTFSDIAHWINRAPGRGEGKIIDALAPILNVPLFSPRLTASRFQVLNPIFYMKMTPAARRIAVREMMRSTGTISATVGLAALAGAHTSLDPRNANFGKIVAGNTHLDVGAGELQAVRYMAQMTDAFAREAKGEKLGDRWTPQAITLRFMRSKLGPLPSYAVDVYTGKDYSGNPVEWKSRAVQMAVPFVVNDLREGWKDSGAWGALKAAPAILGVGASTYKEKPKRGGRFGRGRSHSYTDSEPQEPRAAARP